MSAGKSSSSLVPDWAFFHLRRKHRAALDVFFVYCYHAKNFVTYPAARTIAAELGVSRQQVMEQIKTLKQIGAITDAGKKNRVVMYRIADACPVNAALTGSCQHCPDKTLNSSVNEEPTKCQRGAEPSVNSPSTKNDRNGTERYENGTNDASVSKKAKDEGLDANLRLELVAALSPLKVESEIGGEIRSLVKQVGLEGIPRLIGWLKSDSLSWADNKLAAAIRNTKDGKEAPVITKSGSRTVSSGTCAECGNESAGSMLGGIFWCLNCQEAARKTYCGMMTCRVMHYPWEPCGVRRPKRSPQDGLGIRGLINCERCGTEASGWLNVHPPVCFRCREKATMKEPEVA